MSISSLYFKIENCILAKLDCVHDDHGVMEPNLTIIYEEEEEEETID